MATGESDPAKTDLSPHGNTKLVKKFTVVDYSPLTAYDSNACANFRGASYFQTTPTSKGVLLYRRYGGAAGEDGQYWSIESREGNLGLALGSAILPNWKNTFEKQATLFVPSGVMMFEGYAAPQGRANSGFHGGDWQVFIPKEVVQALSKAQKAFGEGRRSDSDMYLKEANNAQRFIIENFEKSVKEKVRKQIADVCCASNVQHLLKKGNGLERLPTGVRSAITSEHPITSTTSKSSSSLPTESFLVHRQKLRLFNGSTISLSLHVRIQFSHETSRTYTSGKTIIREITRHYNRIMEWK